MNKRQRRKLAKSLDCIHLKSVDDGFSGHYEYELKYNKYSKYSRNNEPKFSRKELKHILQYWC